MSDDANRHDPAPNLVLGDADGGRLAENIMHFARVLRTAGLPVGPGKVLDAIDAVSQVGVASRRDFYWTLHAVFVNRRDQREVFDQAFHFFWRNPNLLERMMGMLLPAMRGEEAPEDKPELSPRVAEALAGEREPERPQEQEEEEIELDAALSVTDREVLAEKDFEKMTKDELDRARQAIKRMRLPIKPVKTRRYRADPGGRRADLRATLRASARQGGDLIWLKKRSRRRENPPLVVLCDISGSMDRYARMLLHFLHALTNDRDRVHSFLFGTRLTNITRHLRDRDPDAAIDKVTAAVEDWAGGTRIGESLHRFNADWSRRVLSQGPVVLLITDGLDREGAAGLEVEMERLHKSCRRLIWLNPLLRYDGYAPKTAGARAMIPHVDEFRPVHNLDSLAKLADTLSRSESAATGEMVRWKKLAA
ncbi:VWA domain-containing protein [Marivibrio halodurans]|uniref:VWA domain-containing protein n=1 Tax=Marivibrio halodurans TaxID=2039722 RepID=A0A8J7RVZ5_9PROT|nr:VWA domain-containing protein [Marivibrio halodurans]MBP5855385.1 VWA domain-containing protein [Marivibrio halodurans]